MQAFTIDEDNNITVFASSKEAVNGGGEIEIFTSDEELAGLASQWRGTRLIEIWNGLPGVDPVRRFTSKPVAVTRIWKAIQHLKHASDASGPRVASKNGGAKNKVNRAEAQPNSKAAQLIALLREPQGATLQSIMRAMGWQAHSVRGFISRQLGKKMGLRVRSFKRDGERVYAVNGK